MRRITIATVLVCSVLNLPAAFCQGASEPDTPTVAETIKYINDNTSAYLKIDGTVMESQGAVSKNIRTVDLLDLQTFVGTRANSIEVFCEATSPCITVKTNVANDPHPDLPSIGYMGIATQDEEMAQRVARAMTHLLCLLRKQTHPVNDPFAKPQ